MRKLYNLCTLISFDLQIQTYILHRPPPPLPHRFYTRECRISQKFRKLFRFLKINNEICTLDEHVLAMFNARPFNGARTKAGIARVKRAVDATFGQRPARIFCAIFREDLRVESLLTKGTTTFVTL